MKRMRILSCGLVCSIAHSSNILACLVLSKLVDYVVETVVAPVADSPSLCFLKSPHALFTY
ncbi:hypothetical protein UY286_19090 [Paenibacillus polymyxa]|uniref:hypothetical protein n=1 Tax=Paenibacillus polymyxa TaxID=1406 RepID=UPI002AB469F8|nr:hypothetical protein [Paenibacillus polymyxa]MDY8119546.1 hypothetical protein [Paenibacillus polymyxa]